MFNFENPPLIAFYGEGLPTNRIDKGPTSFVVRVTEGLEVDEASGLILVKLMRPVILH